MLPKVSVFYFLQMQCFSLFSGHVMVISSYEESYSTFTIFSSEMLSSHLEWTVVTQVQWFASYTTGHSITKEIIKLHLVQTMAIIYEALVVWLIY